MSACLCVVMGKHFGRALRNSGKALVNDLRDVVVKLLAPALEQRVVGGIAYESVLENVARLRQRPPAIG